MYIGYAIVGLIIGSLIAGGGSAFPLGAVGTGAGTAGARSGAN